MPFQKLWSDQLDKGILTRGSLGVFNSNRPYRNLIKQLLCCIVVVSVLYVYSMPVIDYVSCATVRHAVASRRSILPPI